MNYNNYRATNEIAVIAKHEKEAIECAYLLSAGRYDKAGKERLTDDYNRSMNLMSQATEVVLKITNPIYK